MLSRRWTTVRNTSKRQRLHVGHRHDRYLHCQRRLCDGATAVRPRHSSRGSDHEGRRRWRRHGRERRRNALMLRGAASEIVLIDRDPQARSSPRPRTSCTPRPSPTSHRVRAGDCADLEGAAAVILAARVSQQPGETGSNCSTATQRCSPRSCPRCSRGADTILAGGDQSSRHDDQGRNPIAGTPQRVIGSGTILDTARFRALLGAHLRVSPKSVHAYVLGEHGDSEVLCWSVADVGSITVEEFGASDRPAARCRREGRDRSRAYAAPLTRYEGKGATWYGIAGGLDPASSSRSAATSTRADRLDARDRSRA